MRTRLQPFDPQRRRVLGGAAAGLAGLLQAACGGGGEMGMNAGMGGGMGGGMGPGGSATPATSRTFLPTGLAWREPPLLANTSAVAGAFAATLTAAPTRLPLVSGIQTEVFAYNGSSPGPLIEAFEGDAVRVTLVNRLAMETTVHWHGLPVPADQDGNPMDPVAPGASRDYVFTLPPGSAGTWWAHPHAHRTTHEQVHRGLACPFIVRSRSDPLAHLPERRIFISDLRLDGAGQIAPNDATDFAIGREGDQLLVNGLRRPVDVVAPGQTERWRLWNATNARYLLLVLDGAPMTLVALDGCALPAPRAVSSLLLAPAQRAEIVVRAPASPGATFGLRTEAHARGMGMSMRPGEPLFELSTSATAVQPAQALPAALPAPRPLPAAQRTQSLVLADMGMMGMGMGMGMGMSGVFTINGRSFDPARDDLTMRAGVPEDWLVRNDGMMDHPLHIHGCAFQCVASSRADSASDPRLGAFMDTANVRPGETLRLRLRIDTPGRRMFHCHILEHEDQGMMGVVNVLP